MQLNTTQPGINAKKKAKRVGRGIGSGSGKTCGRGHKGFNSRSGSSRKWGFEGGQMPLQRRVPKLGFTSRKARCTAEVRLSELNKLQTTDIITLEVLKLAGIVSAAVRSAKVIVSGKINKAIKLKGILTTAGAKAAIESAGGEVIT